MRIALVITGLGVGGAERLVTSLADRFAAMGHTVLLIYLTGPALVMPTHPSVAIFDAGMKRSPWGALAASWRVRRALKSFRPDVVNSHLVHTNLLTRLLRLTMRMPKLISSAHNTNEEGRGRMLAYRLTDGLADISTNVSDEAVEAFIAQGAVQPGRMVSVHNGVDIEKFCFRPTARVGLRLSLNCSDNKLIMAVGRLYEPKDYPNLLRAFAQARAKAPGVKLAIVGEGPLRSSLVTEAASLGVVDDVQFLGIRHDVPELLSACDVFVLSSAWEGLPLVILEAMACERVVVATDCGGVREVVGEAGLLVEPKNSEELADALTRALHLSPAAAEELGHEARNRVEEFYSIDAAVKKWLSLYKNDSSNRINNEWDRS